MEISAGELWVQQSVYRSK